MLKRTYEGQVCSIARSLEVVGERWTLLIIRDIALGLRRFDEIQQKLGIARNVLTARLERLVDEGLVERRRYHDRPPRHEYHLTGRGRDLVPVLVALMHWGDRYLAEGGPPRVAEHSDCGGRVTTQLVCRKCGENVESDELTMRRGRGAKVAA